jgi:hypothetical protein
MEKKVASEKTKHVGAPNKYEEPGIRNTWSMSCAIFTQMLAM